MIWVEKMPAAMADHHLAKVAIPAEMNANGPVFRILSANLEVLPHLRSLAVVRKSTLSLGLSIAFDR